MKRSSNNLVMNLAIFLGFFGMIIFALILIIDDVKIVQKNTEIELKIKDKMNVCKTQDANQDELLMSF